MNILKPPPYCPDALPTANGWVDPKTNQLIVSVKNLLIRRQQEFTSINTPEELQSTVVESTSEVAQTTPALEQPVVRRGRGRPRKYPLPTYIP
jgi:hypothetical protein